MSCESAFHRHVGGDTSKERYLYVTIDVNNNALRELRFEDPHGECLIKLGAKLCEALKVN